MCVCSWIRSLLESVLIEKNRAPRNGPYKPLRDQTVLIISLAGITEQVLSVVSFSPFCPLRSVP